MIVNNLYLYFTIINFKIPFSFPLLDKDEIFICLSQMNVENLSNKKPEQNYHMYEKIIEFFTGKNFDTVSLPKLSGVDCLLYPELHEESVIIVTSHRVLQKIFFSTGVKDFSLSDYFIQNNERFQKITSGVINLARFRVKTLSLFDTFSKKTNILLSLNSKINLILIRQFCKSFILKKSFFPFSKILYQKKSEYAKYNLIIFYNKIVTFYYKKFIRKIRKLENKESSSTERTKIYFFEKLASFKPSKRKDICEEQFIYFELKTISSYFKKFIGNYILFCNCENLISTFLKNYKKIYSWVLNSKNNNHRHLSHFKSLRIFSFFMTKKIYKLKNHYTPLLHTQEKIIEMKKKMKNYKRKPLKNFKKFFFILKIFRALSTLVIFPILL